MLFAYDAMLAFLASYVIGGVSACKLGAVDYFGGEETSKAGRILIQQSKGVHKIDSEQKQRLAALENECQRYDATARNRSRAAALPHLIVDEKHKVLFCAIPKVASSNWKRVFIDAAHQSSQAAAGIRNVHARKLLPDLRDYPTETQDYMLANYYKFLFVRHPLERLLSAFKNKLENRPVGWERRFRDYVDMSGTTRQEEEVVLKVKSGNSPNGTSLHTISFREFAGALTDSKYKIERYNTHWKQYYKLCHPCVVRYHFVGKLETITRDLQSVKDATGLSYERWFDGNVRTTIPDIVNEYFQDLDPDVVNRLIAMYDIDLQLFSYTDYV